MFTLENGGALPNAEVQEKVPSLGLTIWREIKKSKPALVALFLYVGIVLAAVIISFTMDMDYLNRVHLRNVNLPPDWFAGPHFLGTDDGGRDMVAQLIAGARNSFGVTFAVTIITLVFGTLYGLVAGFFGGHVENIMMRIVDFVIMLPTMMIIIVILVSVPHYHIWHFIGVMSIFMWVGTARLIRSAVLRQSTFDYVAASKTLGTRNFTIIFREVLPNVTSIIVTNSVIILGANMGMETGLTAIGYGLPFGVPSLGRQIARAINVEILTNRPWQWLPASILVFVMIMCTYIVGQAISRAVDPKQQRQ